MVSTAPQEQQLVDPRLDPSARTLWNGLIAGAVVGLLVLLGLLLLGLFVLDRSDGQETGSAGVAGMTQTVDGGNVTIKATWAWTSIDPVFDVALDTHSVDLDSIDLTPLAVLRLSGVEIQSIGWDAPNGGHHREGKLVFPTTGDDGRPLIGESTERIELLIRDVAGVSERVFVWTR